jgi:hypothetical protein
MLCQMLLGFYIIHHDNVRGENINIQQDLVNFFTLLHYLPKCHKFLMNTDNTDLKG